MPLAVLRACIGVAGSIGVTGSLAAGACYGKPESSQTSIPRGGGAGAPILLLHVLPVPAGFFLEAFLEVPRDEVVLLRESCGRMHTRCVIA